MVLQKGLQSTSLTGSILLYAIFAAWAGLYPFQRNNLYGSK